MKKFFMFLAVSGLMIVSAQFAAAQENDGAAAAATDTTVEAAATEATPVSSEPATLAEMTAAQPEMPIHQQLKTRFIEGGAGFMATILACFVLGLALCIERILYLGLSKTNTKKLLNKVEEALKNGGIEAAKDVCRNTRGPVASIFYQGLLRAEQGLEVVEKTVVSYGSVQMSLMEKGLSWIQLFITIAPSLGFLGTVVGMIQAFDAIQAAGDISPNVVAGGMKVALITTVGGLIVAVILQLFYNYILSRIDSLSIEMEDASISLIDILVKNQK